MKSTKIESWTHHTDVPLLGAHLDLLEILGVGGEVRQRAPRPLSSDVEGEQLARHPRTLGRSLGGQLEDRQPPLHEGNHPLPVEIRDDGSRRQPSSIQALQRVGEALELGLLRRGRHPPVPLRRTLPKNFVSKHRERATEVSKVEPPSAPPGIVRRHLA